RGALHIRIVHLPLPAHFKSHRNLSDQRGIALKPFFIASAHLAQIAHDRGLNLTAIEPLIHFGILCEWHCTPRLSTRAAREGCVTIAALPAARTMGADTAQPTHATVAHCRLMKTAAHTGEQFSTRTLVTTWPGPSTRDLCGSGQAADGFAKV